MRIAMVIQGFAPVIGGAQRQVQRLAPHLAERGAEVSVVTRRWMAGTAVSERQDGLRLWRVPGSGHNPVGPVVWPVGATAAALALRPDVIHAHDLLSPATVGLAAGRPLRAPVVAKVLSTGAGGDVDRLLAKPFGATRLRAVLRGCAGFICLAADVERELLAHGVAPERLHRIPNGVDHERFRPPSAEERAAERAGLGLPRDGMVTLYCGRLWDVKRLDVLLHAFARVPGRLVLAGDGPEGPRLRAMAEAEELRGRVTFAGAVDDPAPLYRAADVYASASLTEGMSGSVLEAMATGLAVVASPASGMQELLGGGAGVIADDESVAALAHGLGRLAGDSALRRTLGERARERVERQYTLGSTADALMALYRMVRARR